MNKNLISMMLLDNLLMISPVPKKSNDIKSVTFNQQKGVTTVVLKDGRKGIAKVAEGDEYDERVGFALAYCYAIFGSKTKFNKEVGKYSSMH